MSVLLRSRDLTAEIHLPSALVLSSLTSVFPAQRIPFSWPHLEGLELAEPNFHHCSPVDVVFGADIYGSLMRTGTIQGPPGTPSAHLTVLGWVLMGPTSSPTSESHPVSSLHCLTLSDLSQQVQRFWEQNEVSSQKILSPEETYCDDLFQKTHARDDSGRYTVRLPVREGFLARLSASHRSAVQQLYSLERRLARNKELQQKYDNFLSDYCQQGHMERASPPPEDTVAHYLPHHAVVKTADPTKKVRVVFNAFARTTTGYSLNDCLLPGPKLQSELWLVLSRWRLLKYGVTADIVQMF